jgi:pyrroloquinoline quinone (PQQ) biosynthesis protein C
MIKNFNTQNQLSQNEEREFQTWIDNQTRFVLEHRGLKHELFDSLDQYTQNPEFLKITARQLYNIVLGFPFHIAGAIASSRDEDLLELLVRNLYTEIGGESDKHKRHLDVFRDYLLSVRAGIVPPQSPELWMETIDLENQASSMYRSPDMGTKLGSLFAFETMSSPMVTYWHNSLSKLCGLKSKDYKFFTIHQDVEKDHADDIARCCSKYFQDQIFQVRFKASSNITMENLEKLWDKMEETGKDTRAN